MNLLPNLRVASLRVASLRVASLRVASLRVASLRVASLRGTNIRATSLAPLLIAALGLASGGGPVHAAPPAVVADLPVPWSLTAQVMEGVAVPQMLVAPGTDPHELQLRPSQLRLLAGADLVIWTGPQMLPPVGDILQRLKLTDRALALLDIAPQGGTEDAAHADKATGAPDHRDEAQEDKAHGDEAHADDLHAWLDPQRSLDWVAKIAERLAQMDPDNAQTYAANATRLAGRITAAQTEVKALLAPVRDLPVVVFHDAYDPFADRFGLTIISAITGAEGASGSARRLAELRQTMITTGARCAFHEPHQSDDLLRNISGGTGITIATLDASGAFMAQTPDLYPKLLVDLARAIATCQTGAPPLGNPSGGVR